VILIVVVIVGGAIASVLIQRASEDEPASAPPVEATKEVREKVGGLSLSEKADQVVIAGFDDPAAAEKAIGAAPPGGVLVGAEDGGAAVASRLHAAARKGAVPPLIAGPADPALGEPNSAAAAASLRKAGFDLNLGPIADVATLDSPIADRSYGDDPALVASLVGAAAAGCESSGLACAVAHFPGEGAASDDTARGPATVGLDPASLEARDLRAFRAAFDAGAPATVLSLAFFAAYDPATPAALSPRVATELLREELGFKGVAISDDLTAGAIAGGIGAPEAAVQALAAGSDMVVVDDPALAAEARAAILAAAKDGGLSAARLDQAVARVLELKKRLGLQ
jgi:beta-N-acetylhexosaminidase